MYVSPERQAALGKFTRLSTPSETTSEDSHIGDLKSSVLEQ